MFNMSTLFDNVHYGKVGVDVKLNLCIHFTTEHDQNAFSPLSSRLCVFKK